MDQYRVSSPDGKEFGPVDLQGLLQWVKEGRVLKGTLVRKGEEAPVPAESLPELAGAFAPAAISPSAPPIAMTVALPSEFRSWEFVGIAWKLVQVHWLQLGLMFLIVGAVSAVPYAGGCLALIVGGTINVGIYRAILGMLAGRPPEVGMMFGGFDRFGQALLASLVTAVLVGLGMVFCIVPGVILSLMWLFTPPILAETTLEFWDAMTASADLTAGYRWDLFCLCLACLCVAILGLLACGIGIVIAEAVIFTSFALAYRFLQARQADRTRVSA
jgi:uncharacterized membrane protein